jgi:hypothetical protein
MRRFLILIVLSLPVPTLGFAAEAADLPKACPAPAHPARQTLQQHFTSANQSHDGHLTAEEAKGGYADVSKHFDDIDVEHKGYVTENDIRAWEIMRKAGRRLMKAPEDKLRPRSAVQRTFPDFPTMTIAGKPSGSLASGR